MTVDVAGGNTPMSLHTTLNRSSRLVAVCGEVAALDSYVADDINVWRVADLRAFAESHPNAPTVVVLTSTLTVTSAAESTMV